MSDADVYSSPDNQLTVVVPKDAEYILFDFNGCTICLLKKRATSFQVTDRISQIIQHARDANEEWLKNNQTCKIQTEQ